MPLVYYLAKRQGEVTHTSATSLLPVDTSAMTDGFNGDDVLPDGIHGSLITNPEFVQALEVPVEWFRYDVIKIFLKPAYFQ